MPGSTLMRHDYGFIKGYRGKDKDEVDCYIGNHLESNEVYIIHQMKAPEFERFDEDKIMIGFHSADDAKAAYLAHYDNPRFFGGMTTMNLEDFKKSLDSGSAKTGITAESIVSKSDLEDVCNQCGTCCHEKVRLPNGDVLIHPDRVCKSFDVETNLCKEYDCRHENDSPCATTEQMIATDGVLPEGCPYTAFRNGYVAAKVYKSEEFHKIASEFSPHAYTSLLVEKSDEYVDKGDYQGHPFRGNQWADGLGSGDSAKTKHDTKNNKWTGRAVFSKKHGWRQANGKPLPPHIAGKFAGSIPPDAREVELNMTPGSRMLVRFRDKNHKMQSRYAKNYQDNQREKNLSSMSRIADEKYDELISKNERNARNPELRERAALTRLMLYNGMRIGSGTETSAKEKAFGARELEGRHIVVRGNQTRIVVDSKSGVEMDLLVNDRKIAAELRDRARRSGRNGRIYGVNSYREALDYSKSIGLLPKNMRTIVANRRASEFIARTPRPTNMREYNAAVRSVGAQVAEVLGHTVVNTTLKSYIDPHVFRDAWLQPEWEGK